ncbi:hypothetical protein [Saccharopolyspora cebuensis]|uniref:Uncharacterized protein n=1 Tax=Saccharopolyspora cebuensis TaxID=418759 RepID=A0ABV4CG09_9PSEU
MHEALTLVLGLLAWAVIFIPLFLAWWWPDHRRRQRMREATQHREERLRRRTAGRAA